MDTAGPAARNLAETVQAFLPQMAQEVIAQQANMSGATLSRIKRGQGAPSWHTLDALTRWMRKQWDEEHGGIAFPNRETWYDLYAAAATECGRRKLEPFTERVVIRPTIDSIRDAMFHIIRRDKGVEEAGVPEFIEERRFLALVAPVRWVTVLSAVATCAMLVWILIGRSVWLPMWLVVIGVVRPLIERMTYYGTPRYLLLRLAPTRWARWILRN
ncbi:hypothetical protein, partial [Streptomyces scabiei]|uniref:hypothetical protein n=1 Tax=Streptomyces scabiei TaxID=1930 RepID=UPI00131C0ECF